MNNLFLRRRSFFTFLVSRKAPLFAQSHNRSLPMSARACGKGTAVVALLLAVGAALVQRTVWWAGYDLRNCPGCVPAIDWSAEVARKVGEKERRRYVSDGVVVLRDALSARKVAQLAQECDRLSNTFMTSVLAAAVLPFYLRYEHRPSFGYALRHSFVTGRSTDRSVRGQRSS